MIRKTIDEKQIIDLYNKFINYYKNSEDFLMQPQSYIVDEIKKEINIHNWNESSLTMYINNLCHLIKGEEFKQTINSFAKKYFLENIKKDLGDEKYYLAEKSLKLHEEYYASVTGKDKINNQKFIKKDIENNVVKSKQKALNQILYGSPGTGKTFNTINKAIEIIDSDFYQQHKDNRDALKERFEEYKKSGQIEFITFHQSFSYEEFVEGIKAETSEANISYEVKSGVFKKLSNKSLQNFNQSNENIKNKKDFETVFKELILDKLKDDEKLEIRMKKSSFFIKEVDENKISFDKSGGESQHVLLIKNLKNMYEAEENKIIIGGLSQYYNPLLEYLLKNSEIKNTDKEPLKNYILIIDEINRGNISKIFGELITLIEPSKRIGADEEIRLKLPYSQELFGVSSNLYIIGTMNTADRSIALMDTALRRRFHFEEMMPNSSLLENLVVDGIKIDNLLETINKRVEYLYDRDHTIGHAYFMSLENFANEVDKKAELENIFRNKIIPLLQEYFYDDWEKVRLVLGDGFVEKIEVKSDIFDEDLIKDSEYLEEEKFIYNIKKEFDFSKFKD